MASRITRGHAGHCMKLLVDMNLSPRWIGVLTSAGVQAVHWSTLGAKTATDSEIHGLLRSERLPCDHPRSGMRRNPCCDARREAQCCRNPGGRCQPGRDCLKKQPHQSLNDKTPLEIDKIPVNVNDTQRPSEADSDWNQLA